MLNKKIYKISKIKNDIKLNIVGKKNKEKNEILVYCVTIRMIEFFKFKIVNKQKSVYYCCLYIKLIYNFIKYFIFYIYNGPRYVTKRMW